MRSTLFLVAGLLFLIVGFTAAAADSDRSAAAVETPAMVGETPGTEEDALSTADTRITADVVTAPSTSGQAPTTAADTTAADTREEADERDEVSDRNEDDRRSRWWSRRNRYPEPTFTPDEWRPPEGPIRIGLQAGHWKAHEAPDELNGLRYGGTQWEGLMEWEVNLAVAERTGEMLEALGYEVDILPAVVPPDYHAHLFIAIHADGAEDPAARGYRVAAPRRDYTGRAQEVVDLLLDTYGDATGLRRLPDVTRRMQNYYAFNVRRYEHSLDPRTIALILETGFLTSPTDRRVIVEDPDRVARGIVEAVRAFPVTALADAQTVAPDPGSASTR